MNHFFFEPVCIGQQTFFIPKTFVTERLYLRQLHHSDTLPVFESFTSRPEVTRYLLWATHVEVKEAEVFVKEAQERQTTDHEYTWAVVLRSENKLIGLVSCCFHEDTTGIGYLLSPDYWRQGIVTEAAGTLAGWIRRLKGIRGIWATCDAENLGSRRTLEKLGLVRQGVLPEPIICPNISQEPREGWWYWQQLAQIPQFEQQAKQTATA